MAHARARGPQGYLYEGLPRTDNEGRHTLCSRRDLERPFFRRLHLAFDRCLCLLLRPLWPIGPAGSHGYSNGAAPGLLLPLALCSALVLAALDGNSRAAHRAGGRNPRTSALAILFW